MTAMVNEQLSLCNKLLMTIAVNEQFFVCKI